MKTPSHTAGVAEPSRRCLQSPLSEGCLDIGRERLPPPAGGMGRLLRDGNFELDLNGLVGICQERQGMLGRRIRTWAVRTGGTRGSWGGDRRLLLPVEVVVVFTPEGIPREARTSPHCVPFPSPTSLVVLRQRPFCSTCSSPTNFPRPTLLSSELCPHSPHG